MALPTVVKTWTISPNNRIVFTSLIQTMREYLFGVKDFLKTTGTYTVIGSSNGTTGGTAGAPDGVDRWTTATDAGTRGTAAATVQSWVILRDGNAVDILIAFQGASDDIARISFSPGQLFVVPATTTNQPTATDEVVVSSALTLINATASADRLWNGWVSTDKKLCRFVVARSGVFLVNQWGIELVTSKVSGTAVSWTNPVVGFSTPVNAFVNQSLVGHARVLSASVAIDPTAKFMMEVFAGQPSIFQTTRSPAQGGLGYPMLPLSMGSIVADVEGKLCSLIDWWYGRSNALEGDTYGSLQFINVGIFASGVVWPWDGVTTPVLT
jgi:hypothetical protein